MEDTRERVGVLQHHVGLAKAGSHVALLDHPNVWYRRKARRLLTERRAGGVADGLRRSALNGRGVAALEALWTLHGSAGLDEDTAERLLEHPDAEVRAWCVRLLGDEPTVTVLSNVLLVASITLTVESFALVT